MGRSFFESACMLLLGSLCVFVLRSGGVGLACVDASARLEMMVIVAGFRVVILFCLVPKPGRCSQILLFPGVKADPDR